MALLSDQSKKWILVGVMSLLMVAFALPSYMGSGGHGGKDFAVGTAFNGQKIMASEVEVAKFEWQELMQIGIPVQVMNQMGTPETTGLPVAALIFLDGENFGTLDRQQYQILAQSLSEYNKHPELFALLKREARAAGIRPSIDKINSIMVNSVSARDQADARRSASIRQALGSLFTVDEYSEQAAGAVKVTRPEIRAVLARGLQALNLSVVVFNIDEFKPTLPPVTDEATRDLFARYGSRAKGDPDLTTNPFGFGYRQGDRVRLETITVPLAELRRAARATKDDYDWEVDANKYYLSNKAEFKITGLSLDAVTPTTPGTERYKTFDEVRTSIEGRLVEARAEQLAQTVQRKLTALLGTDYRAYADSVNKKTSPPATSVGPAFDTYAYLSALAARIETETKVRPSITSFGDKYLDAEELSKADGVGIAIAEISAGRQALLTQYLLTRAKPFFTTSGASREPGAVALEMFEPTPVFRGLDGGLVIARLLDAKENRVPLITEVTEAVQKDAVTLAASEAAKNAATELAESGKEQLLSGVAATRGKTAMEVRSLNDRTPLPSGLDTLTNTGRSQFLQGAFDLLRIPEATGGSTARPRSVVVLPRDGKVVVLELVDVLPMIEDFQLARDEIRLVQGLRTRRTDSFLIGFHLRDAVNQRTGFKPTREAATEETPPGT